MSRISLLHAIRYHNQDEVCRLIDAGADVNISDDKGKTGLFYAVQERNKTMVKTLIDAGADVNVTDKDGKTVLFYAVRNDKKAMVKTLIDAGADVNVTDKDGKTVLFYVVCSGKETMVKTLIDSGADVNVTDKDGKTVLFYADQNWNERVVRALIDGGADVNVSDNNGDPILFYAVRIQKETMVKTLIDAGADVNVTDEDGNSALFHAVQKFNERVVRALIDGGADVNLTFKEGQTVLFYAVKTTYIAKVLIKNGNALVNARDVYGRTPLFYAMTKSLGTARLLLDMGGTFNVRDHCDVSILLFFIEESFKRASDITEGLNLLKKKGVNKNAIFSTLINVVFCSCLRFRLFPLFDELRLQSLLDALEIVKRYIKKDDQKQKIIQNILTTMKSEEFGDRKLLFKNGVSKIFGPLVKLGANPNSADSDGNTALHYATRLSFEEVSQETLMDICLKLKELGASFNAKNLQNQNPLLFVLSEKCVKIKVNLRNVGKLAKVCTFLIENGSSVDDIEMGGNSVFRLTLILLQQVLELSPKETKRKEALQEVIDLFVLLCRKAKRVTINRMDDNLNSPLHLWARLNWIKFFPYHDDGRWKFEDWELLKTILEEALTCGAKLNGTNKNDETPLHLCTTWSAVKLLLEKGANPNVLEISGRTPLLSAAIRYKDRINYRRYSNLEPFYEDVQEDPGAFWKDAFEKNLDPWTAGKEGESVLSLLVKSKAIALAKSLLEVAIQMKYLQEAKVATSLLNVICTDRSTSAQWKSILVEIILKSRRDRGSMSLPSKGETPLHCCCRNIIELYENLLNWKKSRGGGSRLNTKESIVDKVKSTVHWTIAKQLLQYNADCEICDAKGQSCLDIAEGFPALKDLLLKPADIKEVPFTIPWNSVSKTYKHLLDKVARGQEANHVEPFWYHKSNLQSGSFGLVFAGINEKDGREVAIKRIEKLRMLRPKDKREVTSLIALADCEQVVRYFYFFEDDHFSYIILELMEGNLDEYLDSAFDAQKSVKLCKDVVKGLNFLHSSNILHRDLKPSNILFKNHPKLCLKIADFGLSRRTDSTSTTVYGTNAGTRCWIAPEVLNSTNDHSKSSDVFSCGLVLHYILSERKHPFAPVDLAKKSVLQISRETENNILNGNMEGWDESICPEATHLVNQLLESKETERPTAKVASAHPLFWSKKKKIDLLIAVGNQPEFECPRAKRSTPLTAVETDLEAKFTTIVKYTNWNDRGFVHMPAIYSEMTRKRKIPYITYSVVELLRFIRNAYSHVSEDKRPIPIRKLLLEDFVFLEYFPNLVIEVYKAVTTHGLDQREEINCAMNK